MPNWTIANGCNVPLTHKQGTVPDVSGALKDWFQAMVFTRVVKTVVGFQAVETPTDINFQGVMQPFTDRQLLLRPEGERGWSWFTLFADPVLTLQIDEIVTWLGKQTRVMSRKDFGLEGYVSYNLVQDWTGSGPPT